MTIQMSVIDLSGLPWPECDWEEDALRRRHFGSLDILDFTEGFLIVARLEVK